MIDVTITECPRTSFTAALMVLNLNGMRLFAGTLSSIRTAIQIVLIATNSGVLIRKTLPIEKYKLNASSDYNNIINN